MGGGIKEKPQDRTASSERVKFTLFKTLTPLLTILAVKESSWLSLLLSNSATLLRRLLCQPRSEIKVEGSKLIDTLGTASTLAFFLFLDAEEVEDAVG